MLVASVSRDPLRTFTEFADAATPSSGLPIRWVCVLGRAPVGRGADKADQMYSFDKVRFHRFR